MDDERLKNPNHIFGYDYFEEQLARIRDIRSSEREEIIELKKMFLSKLQRKIKRIPRA